VETVPIFIEDISALRAETGAFFLSDCLHNF
jgi:hypothetical protein